MGIIIINELKKATKEELIDIIEERMYLDPDFRRTLEHRLAVKNISVEDQIREFQHQVLDEMGHRSPDTSVIRSAWFALRRNMQAWKTPDFCRGCIAVIRTFDDALCNGAGMEDDSDFEIILCFVFLLYKYISDMFVDISVIFNFLSIGNLNDSNL